MHTASSHTKPAITASIVLYNSKESEVRAAIQSIFTDRLPLRLYLIDNSPTDYLKRLASSPDIEYIFMGQNLGYGSAHNVALRKALENGTPYHIVVNPDILVQELTLSSLYSFMEANKDVGLVMPRVTDKEGVTQSLCKLLPTPFDLFGRRFMGSSRYAINRNKRYELHDFRYDAVLNSPCLSGCFMFIRTDVLKKSGLFDPRYFMYLEDYDLTRRIHKFAQTVVYPFVSVIHGHQKDSYKNKHLLKIHLQSAIRYFNKWGWFFDKERVRWNNAVIQKVRLLSNSLKDSKKNA
jgi:hypothetical protein